VIQCGICQYPDVCGGSGKPSHCGNNLACTNLCNHQVVCDSGTTSITGTVVAGTLSQYGTPDPIYDALVYVPNAPVHPFTPGVQCSQCGADVSGEPLIATQTGPDGKFNLVNMPVGNNIPLVIQLGRWRRQVTIPTVTACTNTALPQSLTRMPRNQSEGDIPAIAIATGNADPTECVLMKMGIDQAEFTQPTGNGRVHIFVANGSNAGNGTPAASVLWGNPNELAKYDMVLNPCEGAQILKSASDQQNTIGYTDKGGRLFTTHYGYTWLFNDAPFNTTATWDIGHGAFPNVTAFIDVSFQKGKDFSAWLKGVGALNGPNQMALADARWDFDKANAPSRRFMYSNSNPLQYDFQTPVNQPPQNQCGRVLFSDFHVTNGVGSQGKTFPTECPGGPMTPQEKALEFMLFDLASCIPAVPQNCTPKTCNDWNISCGPAGDGCGGQLDCGPCTPPLVCGGGGVYGECGYPDAGHCTPKTCQDLGYNCGINGDGCGNRIDCGTCTLPQICGGGGQPSVCGGP
jgi:hypothetical protein